MTFGAGLLLAQMPLEGVTGRLSWAPLALTYNGGTYAVMMGTPQNLEDFAVGFSLDEGIMKSVDDIKSLDVVRLDDDIELIVTVSELHDPAALELSAPRLHAERWLPLAALLPRGAHTAGADLDSYWRVHTYHFYGAASLSDVRGDAPAILRGHDTGSP